MKLFYQLKQYDSNDKLKYDSRKKQSKSFIKAFLHSLYSKMSNLPTTMTDISNTSRTTTFTASSSNSVSANLIWCYMGGLGGEELVPQSVLVSSPYGTFGGSNISGTVVTPYSPTVGIVIGTGTNAITSSDYALQTRILSGKAAGEIEYSGNTFTAPAVSAPNASFTINRIFRKPTGADVIIRELGIYGWSYYGYLMVRDVLGAGAVTMVAGDYLKVTYTFQITA